MQQPKKVPKKGRRYAGRPVKKHGVPIAVSPAPCCEKNSQKTLKQFSQKAHDTGDTTMAWLMRDKVKNE